MICTLSMRAAKRMSMNHSGGQLDYGKVLADVDFVKLVKVFDRGRCADVEVAEGRLAELKEKVGNDFVVSRNVKMQPFSRRSI